MPNDKVNQKSQCLIYFDIRTLTLLWHLTFPPYIIFFLIKAGISISSCSLCFFSCGSSCFLRDNRFFGFSAIAASAGEVRNPVKTIPRAILISMAMVTVLYSLVVLVIIAAGLNEYTESAMGSAARKFLGPVGGMVIITGAIFSMISAANASIMAGSRVSLSMSRLGHFPRVFGLISSRTGTPFVSLLLIGVFYFFDIP